MLYRKLTGYIIEEVWRKKPRQTDVVVLWGKIAAHMLLFRLCSRRVDKRRAGSKIWGDICILHFFIIDRLIFHQMFCGILANTAILLYCIETFCCFCIKTRNTNLHKTSPPTKVKGKCTTPMYTMLHFHTKIS